ncbi:DUF3465 domain-containing protein [Spongiibacter marinus]|uniref:DUF3465 domain-containing protein n=1 Tax=Spongiibacter marinus TaxID=354246 RepID=UPI003C522DD9
MRLVWMLVFATVALAFGFSNSTNDVAQGAQGSDERFLHAYENRQSNLQLSGQGVVEKLLSDDLDGSRHQRFILRLASGQTLLVAHNIDLAPRINDLKVGDMVAFYGEYEWNQRGGVIHWTHHDPRGKHPHGWLKHRGVTYQ